MVVRIVWGQYTDVLIARLHGYLSQVSTALTQSAGESRIAAVAGRAMVGANRVEYKMHV